MSLVLSWASPWSSYSTSPSSATTGTSTRDSWMAARVAWWRAAGSWSYDASAVRTSVEVEPSSPAKPGSGMVRTPGIVSRRGTGP